MSNSEEDYSVIKMIVFVEWFEGNFCKFFFASITIAVVFVGTLINAYESYLPTFISKSFRYGKFSCEKPSKFVTEVPKSYFKHFYFAAAFLYLPIVLYEVVGVYLFDQKPSQSFIFILDLLCGPQRKANVSTLRVFISVLLVGLQILRRFYDTHFVSVFGSNSTMNWSHYLIGMAFYPGLLLIILSEAPKFAKTSFDASPQPVGLVDIIAITIFLCAWYHQHIATVILANARKNKKGQIVSQGYKIPTGDWFEYLSSPHSFAEMLIYTALTIILYKNTGWWYVYLWVIANQVETILLSHWWYQKTFKDFPKTRKALIPFIY